MSPMLDVALFGSLRLRTEEAAVVLRAPPKASPLFAYLLLHRRKPIARETLAFTLWPDETEATARANLRRHLHYLSRALPADVATRLSTDAKTVSWLAAY